MAKIFQEDLDCPECGGKMFLKRSESHGLFYGCGSWPECDCTHGAHPDGRPLGIPANAETRRARKKAHHAFDSLWADQPKGTRTQARGRAYAWLRAQLESKRVVDCHIGMLDLEACERVVRIVHLYGHTFKAS